MAWVFYSACFCLSAECLPLALLPFLRRRPWLSLASSVELETFAAKTFAIPYLQRWDTQPSARSRSIAQQLQVPLLSKPSKDTMAQPSPTPSGITTHSNPSVNLESLDFGYPNSHYLRPFKTTPSKPRNPRRNKNLKQILQDEQKALAAAQAATEGTDTPNGTKASVKGRSNRSLRVEGLQWSDIDAPSSLLPQKKYCDITGLEGKYTDPKTKLRFHNTEVYAVIQTLARSVDQEVLLFFLGVYLLVVPCIEKC